MKICYHCDWCGEAIAVLEVGSIDENKLGFDCLTSEEREDIINVDVHDNTMHVKALCDRCVAEVGISGDAADLAGQTEIYMIH